MRVTTVFQNGGPNVTKGNFEVEFGPVFGGKGQRETVKVFIEMIS